MPVLAVFYFLAFLFTHGAWSAFWFVMFILTLMGAGDDD